MDKQENERFIVTGVLSLLLLSWLGFFLHRSPRFPGSGLGTILGVGAALLMLVPLGYTLAKRVMFVHERIGARISMKALITLHVYAGTFGPLLAIFHTGHRFDSWLGRVLTAVMLLVVVSGYVVRYLLAHVTHEIKEKLILLQTARGDLDNSWGLLASSSPKMHIGSDAALLFATGASFGLPVKPSGPAGDVVRIAESVADLEYSIRLHHVLKAWFGRSLKVHIGLSILFYGLLIVHVAAAVQYGFRWFA
jgi:hypothetical protein